MGKYAIIFVFTLIFALITYSHGLRNVLFTSQAQAVYGYSLTQAQNIAQSTAMIVVNRIREDDNSVIPPPDQVFHIPAGGNIYQSWEGMGGEFKIRVQNQGDSLLTIQSEGRFEERDYLVTVMLDKSDPLWDANLTHAVFAGSSVIMSGSSQIIGDVGTNAVTANAVTFSGNPHIDGSLLVGPGGDPDEVLDAPDWKGTNSWVSGGVTNLPQPLEFEIPPFPDFPPQTNPISDIVLTGGNSTTIPASEITGSYIPEIRIQSDNTLTIDTQGQDIELHIGNLNIQQGHLNFTGGGNVTMNVEDNITVSGSSTANSNGNTADMFINYKGTNSIDFAGATNVNSHFFAETADVSLAGSGGLQGHVITGGNNVTISGAAEAISRTIYAPNADVELTGSGSVRGSIVAETFRAVGNSQVYFEADLDSELPEIKLSDGEVAILSWH
ncbi:MAG: hypothetical protein WEA56_12460 [Balneolaceae bacterium]